MTQEEVLVEREAIRVEARKIAERRRLLQINCLHVNAKRFFGIMWCDDCGMSSEIENDFCRECGLER